MSTQLAETVQVRGLIFKPDIEQNNRLKVARLARDMRGYDGVIDATVGTLVIIRETDWTITRREVVEVNYHKDQAIAAQAAIGVPIAITRAYFDKDNGVIGAEFVTTTPSEYGPREIWVEEWRGRLLMDETPLTFDGVTYESENIKKLVNQILPYDMDQLGAAQRMLTEMLADKAIRQEHEAKIREAYAKKNGEHHWRAHRALSEECTLDLDDKEQYVNHRKRVEDATQALWDAYEDELLAVCHESLGKLRCESDLGRNGDGDPYGFITTGEVALYVLNRWPDKNPFGINSDIRKVIAEEFVRQYLK